MKYKYYFLLLLSGLSANVNAELSSHLKALQSKFQAHQQSARPFKPSDTSAHVVSSYVVVDMTIKGNVEQLKARLRALGMVHFSQYKHRLSGAIPISQLNKLEQITNISWASSAQARTRKISERQPRSSGFVFNSADPAMFTDVVRKKYSVSGKGITIGVLSDSYNCLGTAGLDVTSGDLPNDVKVLKEFPVCEDGMTDEGRAMMQLIHDVAPGAQLMFYTAFVSATDFAQGIMQLANAGANIIVDDVGYLTMPMFQAGPIAQAVNEVTASGVTYFSAAGNSARMSYENSFVLGTDPISTDKAHDFGRASGGATNFYQKITIPPKTEIKISLQWDDPSEISGGEGAKTDLDMFLFDSSLKRVVASSEDNNIGHDPVEFINYLTPDNGGETTFHLYINYRVGVIPTRIKYIAFGSGEATIEEFATNSSTIFGHANTEGAISVGAVNYQQTPWFRTLINNSELERFSSAGGTPILFNDAGHRLSSAEYRFKPEIIAPDNTDTTFFPAGDLKDTDFDNNLLPNFAGTSAAAPHAAAMAALLLEAFPQLTPKQIKEAMMKGSLDMPDPARELSNEPQIKGQPCRKGGQFDWSTGCGLIQADLVFEQVINNLSGLSLHITSDQVAARGGQPLTYRFRVFNQSKKPIKNVRVRVLEMPKAVSVQSVDGCLAIDQAEVSCILGDFAVAESKEFTLAVAIQNNHDGSIRLVADLLADSAIDLSNTTTTLEKNIDVVEGDLNQDGCVDTADWGVLFSVFRTGVSSLEYDLNGDGVVNLSDLDRLESLYTFPPEGRACSLVDVL